MKILAVVLLFPIVLGLKHLCPGGTARCPDSSTCCELLDKSYGCCPLENAVCCNDHIHCCPANTKCSAGMCTQSTNASTSLHSIKSNDVVCPGAEVTCPDETTCCKSPPGQIPEYGCCPMADAVCCKDGVHCCPKGTTCDVEQGKCLGDGFASEMYGKKSLRPQPPTNGLALIRASSQNATNVVCPSSSFQCPDTSTCCKTLSGDWGCCPFPMAQCCADKIHCCPENMHCDLTSQFCSQGVTNTTSLRKVPAQEISREVKDVCPDKTQCDSKSTCCRLPHEKFGCCPYVNATCCSDLLHCCPSGSQCDVKLRRCVLPEGLMSNSILPERFMPNVFSIKAIFRKWYEKALS